MKRGWIVIAGLALLVTAGGAWIAWRPLPDTTLPELSSVDAANVKRIVITPRGEPSVVIEHDDAGWHMSAPVRAGVDDFRLKQLLAVPAGRPTARVSGANLQELDLDKPILVLQYDAETIRFGGINPVTGEQYVATSSGTYTAAAQLGSGIPSRAGAYLRKHILAATEKPVSIKLPTFTVAKGGDHWTVEPQSPDLSADDIAAWLDTWRTAAALRVGIAKDSAKGSSIEITLESGARLILDVVMRQPELVIVRRDEGLEYRLFAGLARKLLEPPGKRVTPEPVKAN